CPDTRFAWSDKAFNTTDTMLDYIKHFNKHSYLRSSTFKAMSHSFIDYFGVDEVGIAGDGIRPEVRKGIRDYTPKKERVYRLLLIDGFASHVDERVGRYCADYDIVLLKLIPHLTHMTQPL